MKKAAGFTLLELMIVLVIMASLSVLSSQSIQIAIKNKIKLQTQIDDVSQVRDALKIIERDVNLAFHYSDIELELKAIVKKECERLMKTPPPPSPQGSPGAPPPPPPTPEQIAAKCNTAPPSALRQDPATHFLGKDTEIFLTTLNSSRLNEGLQQADFIKVGYLLQNCRKPGEASSSSGSCLIRKSSAIVEGDADKVDGGIALLTDVTEFRLRYLGKGKQDWANAWDSKQGDGVAKGRFPDAVEISLTVEKGERDKKKKISMQIVAPIRFPNNTSQDAANSQQPSNADGGFNR